MADFSIPKRKVTASARITGMPQQSWTLFLSEIDAVHRGPERPTDLLNRKVRFIPVLDEADGFVLVQTGAILSLTVPVDSEFGEDALRTEDLAADFTVTAHLEFLLEDDHRIRGYLVYLQPTGSQRLQDYFIGAEDFIAIRDGDHAHVVNTARVVRIKQLESPRRQHLDDVLDEEPYGHSNDEPNEPDEPDEGGGGALEPPR